MDESLSIMLVNTLLVAFVFGPLVCFFLVPLYAYGRITFIQKYKDNPKTRSDGFLFCMIAEHATGALVGLIAIKSTLGPLIPV